MDVFISYASADREHAARLAGTLARAGFTVWWDRTIPPGRVFDEVIQEAIEAARCMVVLWSGQSVKSNWVKTEAAEGAARHRLVPVLVENVAPPIEFKRIQAANLARWEGNTDDAQYRQLEQAIARLVRGDAPPAPPVQPARDEPSARRHGGIGAFGIGAATALIAVALAWFGWTREDGPPPRPSDDQVPLVAAEPAPPTAAAADGTPAPAAPGKHPGRIDLLTAEAGGHLVVASSASWNKLIDGNTDTYGWADSGAGVFAFRDERAATIDGVAVFIGMSDDNNVREFELFAGNDAPTGPFTSIGRFTTQNLRVMRDPWQSFAFTPVTARYVKLTALSNHAGGNAVYINELRLYGRLEATPAARAAAPRY
ncbi:MAG: TIR domain-containing protein [Gammaproteobacteria bacterium]